jgi:hypothetical protein
MTRLARGLVEAGILASAALVSGMAKAAEYELTYDLIVNQGSPPPYASLEVSPLPAGTQVTITATFDTDSADQWNVGAWIYDATIGTIEIKAPGAPPAFYVASPTRQYYTILSDPSWETEGGPGPYSVGLFYIAGGGSPLSGSLSSVFGLASQPFEAATPSDASFSDYNSSFYFTGSPLVIDVRDAVTHLPDALSLFDNSVSDATGSIEMIPEASTWAMLLIGFGGLGLAGYRRMNGSRVMLFS